jgi:glycine betaine/proline transport system permease protein
MVEADDLAVFPVDQWISQAVEWTADNLRPLFQAIKWPVEYLLQFVDIGLHAAPFPLLTLAVLLLGGWFATWRIGLFSALALIAVAALGVWSEAMTTLSLIMTAIIICTLIGIPIGILCARSDLAWKITRPILDLMQTTPTFVYLVPVVMLFGVGTVPGEVAVIIAAIPPLIRFTNLGLRMVDKELVEAGVAFGATPRQLLFEIQLPQAVSTILGGLNQTVLTAMVMSVVIAMIGAEGLGLVVLSGLGRLDVGRAAVGGIAIVLLAMMLDRITQQLAHPDNAQKSAIKASIKQFFAGARRTALPA